MKFGEIDIDDFKVDGLCRYIGRAIIEDMQDPEKRAILLAKAAEIKAARLAREAQQA